MELYTELASNPLFVLIVLWSIPWKLVAIWKAAQNGHTIWYVALFLINLAGLLAMVYIFYFSKKSDPIKNIIGEGSNKDKEKKIKKK